MKKSICTVMLLATAVLAQAQASQFPFEKISKAMDCRMVKITGRLLGEQYFAYNYEKFLNYPVVRFNVFYGAKSSGYSSEDWLCVLPDDSQGDDNTIVAFMGQPAKTYSVEETTGSNKFPLLRYFFSTSSNDIAAFGLVKVKWGDAFNSYCLIGVQAQTGNKSYVIVEKCDFYDISSGQERLVLAGYCPMMDDYKAANLMRVYFEHMYEYYR